MPSGRRAASAELCQGRITQDKNPRRENTELLNHRQEIKNTCCSSRQIPTSAPFTERLPRKPRSQFSAAFHGEERIQAVEVHLQSWCGECVSALTETSVTHSTGNIKTMFSS